jgi:uncharacterized protein
MPALTHDWYESIWISRCYQRVHQSAHTYGRGIQRTQKRRNIMTTKTQSNSKSAGSTGNQGNQGGVQGGTHEQHVKAGQQSHKNDGKADGKADIKASGASSGKHESTSKSR